MNIERTDKGFWRTKNMSKSKMFVLLVVAGVLALAPYGQAAAPNLVQNPRFITGPTAEPNSFAAGWFYNVVYSTSTAVTTRLAPGVKFESLNFTTAGGTTTDRGLWQAIPVVAGATYQVNAQWKGNLLTTGSSGSQTSCNVYVAFGTDAKGPWSSERQLWYKRLGYRQIDGWNVPMSCYVPSTVTSYSFPDFENANTCPATNQTIAGDVPVVVPAGMAYMRVRLAFSADGQVAGSGGSAWVIYDNVTVTGCQGALAGDVDGDCNVDWQDMKLIADTWLACGNMSGSSLCW
jgi:hypothetical protein